MFCSGEIPALKCIFLSGFTEKCKCHSTFSWKDKSYAKEVKKKREKSSKLKVDFIQLCPLLCEFEASQNLTLNLYRDNYCWWKSCTSCLLCLFLESVIFRCSRSLTSGTLCSRTLTSIVCDFYCMWLFPAFPSAASYVSPPHAARHWNAIVSRGKMP